MKSAVPLAVAVALLAVAVAFPQDAKNRVAAENSNEARLNREQPPEKVMDIIGAASGMTIAEIGAGQGRYVVNLANRVGPAGKIYAEDIDDAALRHCAERCRRNGFLNVETIVGGYTDPKLPNNSLDLIFVISSYHHFEDPIALMKNARPALRPTGRLAIAEWVKPESGRGEGTTPETMKDQMEKAGFVLERIDKTFENNRMYIYLFRLPPVEGLPVLSGPYLGQKPPGMTPALFAPGFVSTKFGELNSVFSPDGNEFYFSRRGIPGRPSRLMVTRLESDGWTDPYPLLFSGTYSDIDLFLCPDNRRLVFCSTRPRADGKEERLNSDFWVSHRKGSGWSEPEPFAPEAVSPAEDFFPVVTLSGTLYFNSQREGRGTNDIYASKFSNGKYLPPEKLPAPINTSFREFDAFVSPDEQTIIFSSERPGGVGEADIYVTFRDGRGGWTEPVNLGPEVNSGRSEYGSIISPDGRYFFFTSSKAGNEDIYWVSVEIIERLRPKK